MGNHQDKILWYSFIAGDKIAFSTLFKLYYSNLHNYGLKISNNESLTEDCLQDFFIDLFEKRSSLEHVKSIKAYLIVSFRRLLIKKLKKDTIFTDYVEESFINFSFSPEEIIVKKEYTNLKAKTLSEMLNRLSFRQREVIYLKYYCELSIEEIASVMNISYQSTLNTLQKAFKKLRELSEKEAFATILKNI